MPNSSVDRQLENLLHTLHLFAATFHVYRIHAFRNGAALLGSHGSETLRLQQIDTYALGP